MPRRKRKGQPGRQELDDARIAARQERDEKIRQVNERFLPDIARLKEQHRQAMARVWDDWRAERSKAA